MGRKISYLIVLAGLMSTGSKAQQTPRMASQNDMYCSGTVTSEAVPRTTYVISGPDSADHVVYSQNDYVFVNKGSAQGVKVGDEFSVIRPVSDQVRYPWFVYQNSLLRAMGTMYEDEALIRVRNVQRDTSTAEIVFSCGYVQRGDLVTPFVARPAPTLKPEAKMDLFAPPSGKAKAMIVTGRDFTEAGGERTIFYVNLGSAQGVKVGDYFRVFRYQNGHHESVYQTTGTAYQMYGFGTTPQKYTWSDLPRDVLGEAVVLRVSPNAATVLITHSESEIYDGDYVELQ